MPPAHQHGGSQPTHQLGEPALPLHRWRLSAPGLSKRLRTVALVEPGRVVAGRELPPCPAAAALPARPGWVHESDVPLLGPAGEDGFLGDEAVPSAAGSLVYQVHLALIQPALLEVVVGHARVVLLPGGRGWGGCGTRGDTGSPDVCPRHPCHTCSSCR